MSSYNTPFEIHVHGQVALRADVTFTQVQEALRPLWSYTGARSLRAGAASAYEEEPGILFDDAEHVLQMCWTVPGAEDFRYARSVLGNSIGNIRVWDASHNRSDGDASPKEKLAKSGDQDQRHQWLKNSAIDGPHQAHWEACSPSDPKAKTNWDRPRALAFQRAVVLRAYALYEQLYRDAGFAQWECA